MPRTVYRQRGTFHPKGDIQAIGECLESIRMRTRTVEYPNGQAPVELILEEAKNPDSPLHNNFTWEQSEAARKYNLIEARRLWTSYEVVEISRDGGTTEVERVLRSPANVSIFLEDGTRRYVSPVDAMSVKDTELQLIRECEAQIKGIVNRLNSLKTLIISPSVAANLKRAAEALAKTASKKGKKSPRREAAV